MKAPFSVEEIVAAFRYESGVVYWRIGRHGAARPGDEAGRMERHGYVEIRYRGRVLRAHRVVWVLCNGEWPAEFLDHINGDRADNRIENLRLCTNTQNQANQKSRGAYKGVTFHKGMGKYFTRVAGEYVGTFDNEEAAARAYDDEAVRRYGEFARLNFPECGRREAA